MSKLNNMPIEGTVKNAWLNVNYKREYYNVLCVLHITLEEFPKEEFIFDFFFVRIDRGERVRIWKGDSHPKLGIDGDAIQIIDENGDVKFTVGRSGYCGFQENFNYNFKPEYLD